MLNIIFNSTHLINRSTYKVAAACYRSRRSKNVHVVDMELFRRKDQVWSNKNRQLFRNLKREGKELMKNKSNILQSSVPCFPYLCDRNEESIWFVTSGAYVIRLDVDLSSWTPNPEKKR